MSKNPFAPGMPDDFIFIAQAKAYFEAAEASKNKLKEVEDKGENSFLILPITFLYFRSIELSLKAYLVHEGADEKEIRTNGGHCLKTLLDKAKQKNLTSHFRLLTFDEKLIDQFSDIYSLKWFEYGETLWPDLPADSGFLASLARRLENEISEYVWGF